MKKFIFLEIPHTDAEEYHKRLQSRFPNKSIYSLNKKENKTATSFINMAQAEKKQYRIVKGINHFGLHQYFNTPSNVKYLTLLRDPIDRIISLYTSIKENENHVLHKDVAKSKMSLKTFVSSSLTNELSNYQTSLISGISFKLDRCNFDIYGEAKRNINKHFAHVGIHEHYDFSLMQLEKLIGSDITESPSNYQKQQPKLSISNDVLDLIHERNIYDIILYNKQSIKYRKLIKQIS